MKINDLKPFKENAKKHTPEQIEKIKTSILEYGFIQPIVINSENVVVIGHGRLKAAKELGFKEIKMGLGYAAKGEKFIPVVMLDKLTETQINELRILDNKLNESEWDMEKYQSQMESFSPEFQELAGYKIETLKSETEEIKEKRIKDLHEVVIECESEEEQERVYKEIIEQGYNCRLLTM